MTEERPNVQTILDFFYGLLEPAEAARVAAWLEKPEMAGVRKEAERIRGLLAAAAKSEFPEVRFAPPTPAARPMFARQWGGWLAAAAVLIAAAIPGLWHFSTAARLRRDVNEAQVVHRAKTQQYNELLAQQAAARDRLSERYAEASRKVQAGQANYRAGLARIQNELKAKQLSLVISGPASVLPGAPNVFQIQTVDGRNSPVSAMVSAVVRDQQQQVVYERPPAPSMGTLELNLPADLPLTPNRDLFLEVAAKRDDGPKSELREQIPLALPTFLTHLTTDKPMYQPGETVYFRSLTLERFTLRPPSEDFQLQYVVLDPLGAETPIVSGTSLLTENGAIVNGPDGKPMRGVGAGDWTIPPAANGGEYTLVVREQNGRWPESRRRFLVNRYQPARIDKVLEWSRKTYGPGDVVIANCRASRAEGGPLAGTPVVASATVDGVEIPVEPAGVTDGAGRVAVRLTLPKTIERGSASLNVVFTDGGNTESLIKPIPIALKKLAVEFFPEGGDLVAGAPNRVYFQSRTMLGKPADLRGRIVDSTDREVARVETLTDDTEPGINQAIGRFQFSPEAGQTYRLKIDSPAGIEGDHPLPAVKPDGVVLTALDDATADPTPLRMRVFSAAAARSLLIGAYARGRLLDHRRVAVPANETAEVELKPAGGIGGVTRVTVFEELPGTGTQPQLKPLAERLVFRRPAHELRLTARSDRPQYAPGEKVQLKLSAQDERGQPAPVIVYLGVVNNSVVTMADEKTARSLPTHFLLTSEVRQPEDLEHADILLGAHSKAAQALDLLLGTQGWRRFAEQTPGAIFDKSGADGDGALLAANKSRIPERVRTSLELESGKLSDALKPEISAAQQELVDATRAMNAVNPAADQAQASAAAEVATATAEMNRRESELNEHEAAWQRQLDWLLPAICVAALLMAVGVLVVGWLRGGRWHVPSAALVVVAVAGALYTVNRSVELKTAFQQVGSALNEPLAEPAAMGGAERGVPKEVERLDRAEVKLGLRPGTGSPQPASAVIPPAGNAAPAPTPSPEVRTMAVNPMPGASKAGDPRRAPEELRKAGEKPMADGLGQAKKEQARGMPGQPKGALKVAKFKNPALMDAPAPEGAAFMRVAPAPVVQPAGPGGGRFRGGFGGAGAAAADDAVFGRPLQVQVPTPLVVRQYAYRHSESANPERSDFAETLFWHPALVIPGSGQTISFDLSDSITRYQVQMAGHTLDGRLGSLTTHIEARKPLSIEPKIPVEISSADKLDLPVTIANDSAAERKAEVRAEARGLSRIAGRADASLTLSPRQRVRQLYHFKPEVADGTAELRLSATSDGASDSVAVPLTVVPDGFPVVGSISDALERVARHEVLLPQTWLPGTLKCQVSVFPSTLAELQKGLEGLLQEPGGCFEQTSTTNYPNTLVLDYLRESQQADPEIANRAKGLLERGYAKLAAFEVPAGAKREGFEWFGQSPPHEALTAYGLMQFRDMARVSEVDPALIHRTREYLMSRRDGKGGFLRSARALDTFGRAPDEITNAYIVWALTESGPEDDAARELDVLQDQAKRAKDPYFLALVANALINRGRTDEAMAHLKSLASGVSKEGFIDGAKITITGSTGRMAQIETTALAVLGWLKANRPAEFTVALRSAVGWIGKQRGGSGAFGSTQSTILALKALIAYTRANKQMAEAGELTLYVGEKPVGRAPFSAETTGELTIAVPDVEKALHAGKNDVRVEISGRNSYPYTLAWSYRTVQPPSADGCPVQLATRLAKSELNEGDATQMHVSLKNISGQGHGMTVAILGIPAGLRLPDDMKQLKDLAALRPDGKPGVIGSFEVRGRELVLYWRDLAPDAAIDLNIDLRAHVPGEYFGPASRTYLYYNPDSRHWTAPITAKIKPRE